MEAGGGRDRSLQPSITFLEESPQRRPRIDLNRARPEDLTRLPGIGAVTARRIAEARTDRTIMHPADLVASRIVPARRLEGLLRTAGAGVNDRPNLHALETRPDVVLYRTAFELVVRFDDSSSGVALARLEVESLSHSVDLAHEVSDEEREAGEVVFALPGMEAGIAEVQATIYDQAGNKDYLARTFHVLHNPPFVWFWPSERSARLSRGAALKKSDGSFHCNSSFALYNGTASQTRLSRNMTWRVFDQGGSVIHSGSWDWGSNIVLNAWQYSSGWWFNFSFPPGSAGFSRLSAKQQIRIEWRFTEVGTGAAVVDDLTWRAIVALDVNIIRVGEENFTSTERTRVFNALRQNASSVYQTQDLDVGTIRTFIIGVADAGGYVTINSNGEAEDLTEDWTVSNQAVDMFVVRNYVGSVAGLSPRPGPCNKDAKGMNGTVVELLGSQAVTGVIMAHELGHYLGLPHTNATNNLMNPTVGTANTVVTSSQGNTMKSFPCFLRFLE